MGELVYHKEVLLRGVTLCQKKNKKKTEVFIQMMKGDYYGFFNLLNG